MLVDWLMDFIASPHLEYISGETLMGAAALILCYMVFTIFDNISYFFKRLLK